MFKYVPARYAALLVTMGCTRIGTLHDFRRAEHRRGIADATEGKKLVRHHVSALHIADSNDPSLQGSQDYRALEAFRAIRIENSKDIRIENVHMSRSFDTPNCFIYCLSAERSARMYKEFDGADACVEIANVSGFFRNVTTTLDSLVRVEFQGVHRVTYSTREQPWNGRDWGTHPALLKEPAFRGQAELRAIWTPIKNDPIEPVVLGNFRIPQTCTRIYPK